MLVQSGFKDAAAYRGGFVSIGNFDGVHLGHQAMVRELVGQARGAGLPAVVLTFDPHPIRLLAPDRAPPLLTTPDRKAELLAECGVDCLIVYPTDRALLSLTPREFFDRVLRGELEARGVVEGPNFCFGRGRAGTVETLRRFCDEVGLSVTIAPPVSVNGQLVSSSAIREALTAGAIEQSSAMLGRPYRLTGRVVRGAGRGRQLGFGTANLAEVGTLIPANGVYAGRCRVEDRPHAAAIHIGPNPTFGENARKLEVHLLDYAGGDLYDSQLSVDLLARVRGTETFANVDALRARLELDIAEVRRIAAIAGRV
jgi:riboflavin kinase/FMN adenylyltransferase